METNCFLKPFNIQEYIAINVDFFFGCFIHATKEICAARHRFPLVKSCVNLRPIFVGDRIEAQDHRQKTQRHVAARLHRVLAVVIVPNLRLDHAVANEFVLCKEQFFLCRE